MLIASGARRIRPRAVALLGLALAAACAPAGDDAAAAGSTGAPAASAQTEPPQDALSLDVVVVDTPEDSTIFARTIERARSEHADTLPLGDLVVWLGRQFLGAPYIAGSLDPPGPERLIINLRQFDCVTYVESVLALARSIRAGAGPDDYRTFASELLRIRYRDAAAPDYTERLHYFSDWIAANAAEGLVEDITDDLGGGVDGRAITFMSRHPESYRQLADSATLRAIRVREELLTSRVRHRIGEDSIAGVADGIRAGDVIAATSTVPGLDIAHTGLAVRVDGRLHLMHAPLAGGVVEISEEPLADRIRRIGGQDGIMVARPR